MHELTHVLGFSSNLYQYYQDRNLNTLGKSVIMNKRRDGHFQIRTHNVLNFAKHYFGCNSMSGVALENSGGSGTAGSHWERSELGDEAMTGADINEPSYSLFTIILLHDSGWYNVDVSMADDITWGLSEGCDFVNKKCHAR